jgi:hypothetical protein
VNCTAGLVFPSASFAVHTTVVGDPATLKTADLGCLSVAANVSDPPSNPPVQVTSGDGVKASKTLISGRGTGALPEPFRMVTLSSTGPVIFSWGFVTSGRPNGGI